MYMKTLMAKAIPQTMPLAQEVLYFLLNRPTPEQMIMFKSSPAAQARLEDLLEQNREGPLSEAETFELDTYQQVNHFLILLKAHARTAVLSRN